MAQIDLGTQRASWTTKTPLTFIAGTVQKNRSYLFYLLQPGSPIATRNQYLAVVATIGTTFGSYETPLEAKWFPGQNGLLFVVGIPRGTFAQNVDLQITLLPKEFKPGSASVKNLDVQVFRDSIVLKAPVYVAN